MVAETWSISRVDRAIRNVIGGHAIHLSVEDLYISIRDAKLLEAVDNMRFDHESPIGDSASPDKVYANMTPNSAEKEKREAVI